MNNKHKTYHSVVIDKYGNTGVSITTDNPRTNANFVSEHLHRDDVSKVSTHITKSKDGKK